MISNKKSDINLISERVRAEYKRRGLTQKSLAALLSCDEKTINRKLKGIDQHFNKHDLHILAAAWNLRIEYLNCLDDWQTIEQMKEAVKSCNLENYQKTLDYLSTLGLTLHPMVFYVGNLSEIYEDYFIIKDYLTNEAIDYLKTIIEELPSEPKENDFYENNPYDYDDMNVYYIELKGDPYKKLKPITTITKNARIMDEDTDTQDNYVIYGDEGQGDLEIMYKIFMNDVYIGVANITNISIFFEHIDALCQTSIKTLLENGFLIE